MATDPAPDVPEVGPALVAPARTQLVGLAAEVLGRLPAEQVPPTLRAIARFAPAKRQRLGAAALAAALDTDADFRASVADAVEESSPGVVRAVRDGSTAACDPVDVAVVAYLTRPSGWSDVVVDANARWSAERGEQATADAEITRLRDEVARLRAAARAEPARVRDAVDRAAAATDTELTALRRAVRDRTRELRAAERARAGAEAARDAAEAARAAAEIEVDRVRAAHELELRRLQGRLAEAGRAAETVRRGVRAERDVDDARLWLLVDTVVQAASGIRRELALPAPAIRPADVFASGSGPSAGRSVADAAGLAGVLALPNVHLVVDGYNVTKTGYPELTLEQQRTRLVGSLAALGAQSGAEVTVVFDGSVRPPVQPTVPRGVRVLFSAADEIADDVIRALVAAEPPGRPVVVVTSDRQIVDDTARAGVWAAASSVLLDRLG